MPIINTVANASGRAYGFTRGGDARILLSTTPGPSATISTYSGYIVFKFTATGTLNVGAGAPGTADALVVGGGSSATNAPSNPLGEPSGNGGAGGKVRAIPGTTITASSPIPIVVGGTATASSFGASPSAPGSAGGTGGAGATAALTPGTAGGSGPTNNYETGSNLNYAGGGGGGGVGHTGNPAPQGTAPGGAGGATGGGSGGPSYPVYVSPFNIYASASSPGSNGTANTGGGGGGRGAAVPFFGAGVNGTGGSGVVIIRFPDSQFRTS